MEPGNDICVICADSYTKDKRKPVNCPKPNCNFECCIQCLKKQCLSNNDPMCLNPECRAIFSQEFLYSTFSNNFMKGELRKHRANVLMEQELGMMNTTMPYVESRIRKEEAQKKLKDLQKQQIELNQKINEVKREIRQEDNFNDEKGIPKKLNYLKKCPKPDCRGFLNNSYKCELCKTVTCSKCFEIKEENHVCNEDNLKTAELLRKDTKSCPNCSEMIHKIEGCNQMYCVSCGTGFDWKTLKIVTGVIHNPHYFEYQARNGGIPRAIGDIPCGGLPSMDDIINKISEQYNIDVLLIRNNFAGRNYNTFRQNKLLVDYPNLIEPVQVFKKIQKWAQATVHIRHQEITNLQTGTNFSRNLKKRINYIMNLIDKDNYKSAVIKKDSECIIKNELLQIFTTCAVLLEEQMRKIVDEKTKRNDISEILKECIKITEYINNCLQEKANLYKRKMPKIILPTEDKMVSHIYPQARINILSNGISPI